MAVQMALKLAEWTAAKRVDPSAHLMAARSVALTAVLMGLLKGAMSAGLTAEKLAASLAQQLAAKLVELMAAYSV